MNKVIWPTIVVGFVISLCIVEPRVAYIIRNFFIFEVTEDNAPAIVKLYTLNEDVCPNFIMPKKNWRLRTPQSEVFDEGDQIKVSASMCETNFWVSKKTKRVDKVETF